MSEEYKCNGLDCAICAETKCPNEKIIINGIDVSEYFIDVVDEGGSTINYKLLPNSERLLVEKIFEQNQQLKRLQEENEKLKEENEQLKKPFLVMPKVNQLAVPIDKYEKLYKALEEIREIINSVKNEYMNTKNKELALYHTELNGALSVAESIEGKINEALNEQK